MTRLYKVERLYFQFLRPQSKPKHYVYLLAGLLHVHNFIEFNNDPEIMRYRETEKMTSHQHERELHALISEFCKIY